jgi:hypothetical protein
MEEQWKKVNEFPRYSVSNLGRVRREAHVRTNKNGAFVKVPQKMMRLQKSPNCKYPSYVAISVDLRNDRGNRKTVRVSRLVATAFVLNPDSFPIVNHLDSNPQNNHFENLEWTTHGGNNEHCKKKGARENWRTEGH